MTKIIETLDFRRTIAKSSTTSDSKITTVTGRIVNAILHIPEGAAGLVGIKVFVGANQIFPRDDYVRIVGNQEFPLNFPVRRSNSINVFYINDDTTNSHTPQVVLSIAGETEV